MIQSIFILLFTLLNFQSHANSIQIIQLKHRSADSLLPVITPMLDSSSAISGSGYQLFLRTSPQERTNILELIRQLDTPLKQLLISVFHGTQREAEKISIMHTVNLSHHRQPTTGKKNRIEVKLSTRSETSSLIDNPLHQLKVLEGHVGYIETGQTMTEHYKRAWINRSGQVSVAVGVDRREIYGGFSVLPRIQGSEILLEINPYISLPDDTHHSKAIETKSYSTTLRGEPGQWLEIAGQQTQTTTEGIKRGIQYRTREHESSRVWVRADLIN